MSIVETSNRSIRYASLAVWAHECYLAFLILTMLAVPVSLTANHAAPMPRALGVAFIGSSLLTSLGFLAASKMLTRLACKEDFGI